jgi:hypothetical protein
MRSSLNAKALIEQLLPAYASESKKLHSLSWFRDKALPGKSGFGFGLEPTAASLVA